jgi:lysozyme family protein
MSKLIYELALARLLAHEGGYTNHPSDPGGPMNFGITIFDYRKYVVPGASAEDVRLMKVSEAKGIYRAKYWDSQRCDELEPGVDYAIFDYVVNSGIGRSGKVLRRCLGMADTTSQITPEVVAIANAMPAASLVAMICDERLRFLKSLKTWGVFGKGWGRRVVEVKSFALSIAHDIPIIDDGVPLVPAPGRAINPDEHARVRALQQHLADAGFDPGAVDGDMGARTVKAFQHSRGLMVDGVTGEKTRPLLDAALAAGRVTVARAD